MTWISSSSPPLIFTAATPSCDSSDFLISSSANLLNWIRLLSLKSEVAALFSPELAFVFMDKLRRKIGSSDGLKRNRTGLLISSGSSRISSFSRTSNPAKPISVPQLNSRSTSDCPALDIELIFLTFFTTPMVSSIGLVSKFSISTGAAPS